MPVVTVKISNLSETTVYWNDSA